MLTKTDLQAIDNLMVKRVDQIVTKRIQEAIKPINKKLDLMISTRQLLNYFSPEKNAYFFYSDISFSIQR